MATRIQRMKMLATEEAKKLKKHITKAEAERLDLDKFNPKSQSNCIYGMMTGDCDTPRAGELIMKCASRVYDNDKNGRSSESRLNGKPYEVDSYRHYNFFSPIEILIIQDGGVGYGEKIIDFLKGETKTLKL